jgi:hypothetical protein
MKTFDDEEESSKIFLERTATATAAKCGTL